ncbi:MAG TPA: small ribosomal subunit Rsm22 family protein [Hyphomicrobiaceae bacterium]|nr:small ribosomal subunit Rsm22 family protein [Hyphomicrobiaceae bacterium]
MTSPLLPPDLQARLAARVGANGVAAMRAAQARASTIYRGGGHSDAAVTDAEAALAYAAVRMPATYAACVRAFDLSASGLPDFAPATHLDLGAGPGTAALAASAVWPSIANRTLVEPNPHLRAIGVDMLGSGDAAVWTASRLDMLEAVNVRADLVTVSYVLSELPEDAIDDLSKHLRAACKRLIVIVEPGTPHGYRRILRARRNMLAMGAKVVAPCPHERPCPLTGSDWCHFKVRLQRSALHMALKDADVPYEDEPFAFLAASFDPVSAVTRPPARLLADPAIEKGFADLVLCTSDGRREERRILRRDKAAFRAIRHAEGGAPFGSFDEDR